MEKKQYIPVTTETNQSNDQSINNLTINKTTDVNYSEGKKRLSEIHKQPHVEVVSRSVKYWDGIGREGQTRSKEGFATWLKTKVVVDTITDLLSRKTDTTQKSYLENDST